MYCLGETMDPRNIVLDGGPLPIPCGNGGGFDAAFARLLGPVVCVCVKTVVNDEAETCAVMQRSALARRLTPKTLVYLSVSSAVSLSLLLLAVFRSHDVLGGRRIVQPDASHHESFVVDTPGCKIPHIDPFDPTIEHLVLLADNVTSLVCNGTPALTYVPTLTSNV